MKGTFRKYQQSKNGPGGMDCPCCRIGDRKYHKRYTRRYARRQIKRDTRKAVMEWMELDNTADFAQE